MSPYCQIFEINAVPTQHGRPSTRGLNNGAAGGRNIVKLTERRRTTLQNGTAARRPGSNARR